MSPLAIVKLALSGASQAIELAENFIPAGKLKNILNAVDSAIQEALSVLGQALANDPSAKESCDQLKANKYVVGEGEDDGKEIKKA